MENDSELISIDANNIKRRIFTIRGKQVMLDSDLAEYFGATTGNLNRAMKRNIKRTEQGIAMLTSVLHTEKAIAASILIMEVFVEMRHFIANNTALFDRISKVELKQLEADKKFDQLFEYVNTHAETNQKLFFDGQIYDAFSLLIELIQKAAQEIILIDGYVDVSTLNLLAKKQSGVAVTIYTFKKTKLTAQDVAAFNSQYPQLDVKYTNVFHDRFLILDGKTVYHIGASLKDAGKKCFGVTLMDDVLLALLGKIKGI